MKSLINELINILKENKKYTTEGNLLKNKIVEDALKLEPKLLKLLLSSKNLKKHFFQIVDDFLIFDKIKFQKFVSNKQFLPDSYTSFKNKIGLVADGEYLTDSKEVVLVWPYKDCVLEGGQTKEDSKRNEIFWNETLAPDEIDRLFSAKVFTNWKKYDIEGEHKITKNIDFDKENLIIKGNNLLALHSLVRRFRGKVKLIYIDPPYNTGNDSFGYNDKFNHSTWLTFMKSRLEVAKELLRKDGSIWINIDDNEAHYLKVVCDEVFGRENFVANVIWQKKYTISNDAKYFSDNHDHVLVIAKDKPYFEMNGIIRTKLQNNRYSNPDNDPNGKWMTQPLHAKSGNITDFKYTFNNGIIWEPPRGTFPRYSYENLKKFDENNYIWFGKNGDAVPRLKKYLKYMGNVTPATIWLHDDVGNNDQANRELKKINTEYNFSTPKPEKLIQRIIHISTNENDLILDFFSGSGTTQAVAHKMKRRYIGIEQMDYINTITVPRLQKVIGEKYTKDGEWIEKIKYDEGGISKAVNWEGGGSFVYCELMKLNQNWIDKIQEARTEKELEVLWQAMQKKSFISYKVDFKEFDKNAKEFSDLSFDAKQKFLIETLDKNQLYVNSSEIEDEDYKVSDDDKLLNTKFYGGK